MTDSIEEKEVAEKPVKKKLNKDGLEIGGRVSFEDIQKAKIKGIARQKAEREKKAK